MGKRTNIDFSKHEVTVKKFDGVLIHEFKRPNTSVCKLVFINTCGVMTVTGDFGNWVFCREFHPSSNGVSVDGYYWDEKLEISSQQKSHIFDSEETMKSIEEFKTSYEDNFGEEMPEEVKEWVEGLSERTDDEHEYTYYAYREKPSTIDYQTVPFGTKRHYWLNGVYDGFEALCEAIKREEVKSTIKSDGLTWEDAK